jgi:hypothetical protein
MRKLLELVIIMVFCVSIASGKTIIVISDSGYWPTGAPAAEFANVAGAAFYQDSAMVDYLKSLGYTVDTSGMAGRYREYNATSTPVQPGWVGNPTKEAALNAADLIIISRYATSGAYDAAPDRLAWNALTKPILSQSGQLCRGGASSNQYWGWCNGGNTTTTLLVMPLLMGHEFVDGFGNPITLFSAIPSGRNVANPALAATWDARTSILGTLNGLPMLVDIPAGTNFDTLCGTTNIFGIAGARRVYLGHWGYDALATYSWDQGLTNDYKALFAQTVAKAMSPVKILNNSPANNAALIPVALSAPENDLVFNTLLPSITAVDVYLGIENEPNLTTKPQYKIVNHLSITPGQNTIDLVGELTQNLTLGKDYYWRVIGLEPNAVTSILEPVGKGPVWKFSTPAAVPAISAVSPAKIAAFIGDPNVIFTVTGENIETYLWYKDADSVVGGGTPLSNGADYSGVNTNTLVIKNIDAGDFMYYYCVGTKTGFTPVTSTPSGQLEMKGLKCHFTFDSAPGGITTDAVGGIQAQLMGGASVSSDPNTIVGSYLKLDNPGATASDTQYAEILNSSVADFQEITISAWVLQKTRDIGCVWDFGRSTTPLRFFTFTMGYKDDQAKIEFQHETQNEYVAVFNRTKNWQFVTVTVGNDGVSKIYIDGEFKSTKNLQANLTAIAKPLNYIGGRIYPNLPKFDGLIDELKIYNYVRTTQQIAQDYMAVRTNVTYVCNSEEENLSAWDFDGNCRIDLSDLAVLLSKWLEHDRIYRP